MMTLFHEPCVKALFASVILLVNLLPPNEKRIQYELNSCAARVDSFHTCRQWLSGRGQRSSGSRRNHSRTQFPNLPRLHRGKCPPLCHHLEQEGSKGIFNVKHAHASHTHRYVYMRCRHHMHRSLWPVWSFQGANRQ